MLPAGVLDDTVAGEPPYEGGFLGHYVFGPLGLDVRDARSQLGL